MKQDFPPHSLSDRHLAIPPLSRWRSSPWLVLAAATALGACSKSNAADGGSSDDAAAAMAVEDESRSTLTLPVVTENAREGDLVLHVRTTGQIRSEAVVQLRAEVEGTVAELLVRPGQVVEAGQELLRFDPYPFDLSVREAQAAADEAEQRFLESYVPESTVTGRGPTPEQRRALMNRSGFSAASLRLEREKFNQRRSIIRSPVSGMVDMVNVAAGEKLSSGQQVMTVVDTRHLMVDAQVLEHDLPLLRVGGDATITSAGAPGRILRGRIDAVLPLVDSTTRAGRAIVRLTGDGSIRPGMYADVELEAQRLSKRVLVPSSAIIERDNGRPLVFMVRDDRALWTYVRPGLSNGYETEILPDSLTGDIPVKPGDPVIVEGHLTLTHDASVRATARKESGTRPER